MAFDVPAQLGDRLHENPMRQLAPVTLATTVDATDPVRRDFHLVRPRHVLPRGNFRFLGNCKGVLLSAMPLAVADLTKSSFREILIVRSFIA